MADNLPNNQSPSNILEEHVHSREINGGKTWTTNAKWIVFLLVLFILLLITFILSNCIVKGDSLINGIENFSTILSIFLSVSSIAFAGYTSIETGRQYHNMSKAVTEIETSNKIMSQNYRDLIRHYHDTVKHFSRQMGDAYGVQQRNHVPKEQPRGAPFKSNELPIPSVKEQETEPNS